MAQTPNPPHRHLKNRNNDQGGTMPVVSKHTTDKVNEFPVATDRSSDLDGYTVNFVDITETHSLAPMLASLPGGHCRCPHWGYLFQGRMIVHYDDHDDVIEQGQAFYMPPGHVPEADAGTEFVLFSPTGQLQATERAVANGIRASQPG
jgi:mannose-6-phosphate isomerase-like protein (cupin superfamily)